jgi:phosphatidylglycerophosphatase B
MGSRLLLGMHWPRDLVVATLISWMLVTLATWLAERFCGPLTPPPEEKKKSPKGTKRGLKVDIRILPINP